MFRVGMCLCLFVTRSIELNPKTKQEDTRNLLEVIPVKNVEWDLLPESDLVQLKKYKFRSGLLKKYLLPLLPDPYFRIKLDAVGSFVWQEMDGVKTTGAIAKAMQMKFGDAVEPVHERLGMFIRSLKQSRFITYR